MRLRHFFCTYVFSGFAAVALRAFSGFAIIRRISVKGNIKIKIFCYVCMNIGVALWSGMICLESISLCRGIFVFLGSLVMVNLLLWFAFKVRDK